MKTIKLFTILTIVLLAISCKKEEPVTPKDGNLGQFRVTATFDNGETIVFKQFDPDDSDAGLLVSSCFFEGDNMTIGFGAQHINDLSKSNGISVGINTPGVTSQRAYQWREENEAGTNTTSFLERFSPGFEGVKEYSNRENYRRFSVGGGFCDEEELQVDLQSVDVTRYSNANGGIIEGSFSISVYHKPEDNCANYEKQFITGTFKLKRVNFEE